MIVASNTRRIVGAGAVNIVARTVRDAAVILSATVNFVGADNFEFVSCIAAILSVPPRKSRAVCLSCHTSELTARNGSNICQIYTRRITTITRISPARKRAMRERERDQDTKRVYIYKTKKKKRQKRDVV